MNSFTLRAIGKLRASPEVVVQDGVKYICFCLEGRDTRDYKPWSRDVSTRLLFLAEGSIGEEITREAMTGDQLFVEAIVQAMREIDSVDCYRFFVTGFEFGHRVHISRSEEEGMQR